MGRAYLAPTRWFNGLWKGSRNTLRALLNVLIQSEDNIE